MEKTCKESLVIRTNLVFPNDINNHNTMFGGKLMSDIDMTASISANRHCRFDVVTASTDSVDFLAPITQHESVCLQSYVSWTGRTSMEIFVKVIAEELKTGKRTLAATAFLTFVALDENNKPTAVPQVVPETDEEKFLFSTGEERARKRKERKKESYHLASQLTTFKPWNGEEQ